MWNCIPQLSLSTKRYFVRYRLPGSDDTRLAPAALMRVVRPERNGAERPVTPVCVTFGRCLRRIARWMADRSVWIQISHHSCFVRMTEQPRMPDDRIP